VAESDAAKPAPLCQWHSLTRLAFYNLQADLSLEFLRQEPMFPAS